MDMSKESKAALHGFLFNLRTPLASIRGFAAFVEKDKTTNAQFPLEGHEWLRRWAPEVEVWWNKTLELTELCGRSNVEDYDWKALIEQLMSALHGIEVAADEATKIPHSETYVSGDMLHMIISSMEHLRDAYKATQALLPKLE
jgi:hypothetical protein